MKLPRKIDYACRVLSQLSLDEGKLHSVEGLAQLEQISSTYLVQILNELRTARLVESRRGRHGGYRLNHKAEDISLKDVIIAIEGSFIEFPSAEETSTEMDKLWTKVSLRVEQELGDITLPEWTPKRDNTSDWVI